MRVSIIYDFLKETGGLERVMFFQANKILDLKGLNSLNLLFSYVSEKDKHHVIDELGLRKNEKVNISQIGGSKSTGEIVSLALSLLFPGRLKRALRDRTDLIISHSFMSSIMSYKKKIRDGTKYIVFVHHPPNFLYGRNIKWVNNLPRFFAYLTGFLFWPKLEKSDRKAVRNADIVMVNSEYTASRVKEIYGRNAEVVYPPISEVFKIINVDVARNILKDLGIENKFVLIHGRVIRDKRPDWAIKAFSKLSTLENMENLILIISGTIEERDKIEELVKGLNLEKRVKIVGKVSQEELIALYNSAECLIMSAPKEDFGLVPVEAMACGCPVVAWKDGAGPEETIKENIGGLLARPYDIVDLAEKIEEALSRKWNKRKIAKSVGVFYEKEIGRRFLSIVDKFR